MSVAATILRESDPRAAARLVERWFGSGLDRLERAVLRAAAGDPAGGDLYIEAWLGLAGALVARAGAPSRPPGARHARAVSRATRVPVVPRDRLLAAALAAPVSAWPDRVGLRLGLALALLALIRETVPGARPLPLPDEAHPAWASADARHRAMTLILEAVGRTIGNAASSAREPARTYTNAPAARSDAAALRRVAEVFQLDRQDLADVFRVRRQAVDQWFQRGVPAERQAKLTTILAVAELLARKLRAGSVPGVARTAAKAYGNRTMLQMLAADKHDALLADVRGSFDWASSA